VQLENVLRLINAETVEPVVDMHGLVAGGFDVEDPGPVAVELSFQPRRQKTEATRPSAEKVIKDIRRVTRKQYSAEEKIRIVLEGLRGEESIAAPCRLEGTAESLYYNWSKEFLEAGKKRLAGDTARAATSDEVKVLRKAAFIVIKTANEFHDKTTAPNPVHRGGKRGDDLAGAAPVRRFWPVQSSRPRSATPTLYRAAPSPRHALSRSFWMLNTGERRHHIIGFTDRRTCSRCGASTGCPRLERGD
jgi:transposase